MKRSVVWAVLGFALCAGTLAYAQFPEGITVNIPYDFWVSGTSMPAGHYFIERTGMTGSVLLIRNENGKNTVQAEVLTRLSNELKPASEAKVVFDKQESKYTLSEIFIPGEDGFLLTGAQKTPHKHETVKAKPKVG